MRRWLEHSSRLKVAITWIALILAWEAAWRVIDWKPWLFPAPSHVLDATLAMLNVQTHFGEPVGPGWPWQINNPAVVANPPPRPEPPAIWNSRLPAAIAISGVRLLI